ncbi:unannotated protein [freshwater metagenome]|uniref:Unannotated protein n=1 Tax=freshwater metagenome TaxID=449393 RepID=A0A6J7F9Q6_9ZZZZ
MVMTTNSTTSSGNPSSKLLTWLPKHIEIIVVTLLGLVSVATAYTSFQASLYDSQMAGSYALGQNYKTEAESMYLEANQQYVQDAQTLLRLDELRVDVQFGDAATAALAQAKVDAIYTSSVSDTFAAAIASADAANAGNPETYTSAQDDKAYLAELFDPYQEKVTAADEKLALGDRYNGLGDQLTLYTVLMALSLFLLGVAAVLKKFRMQILIIAVSMVIFTFAAVLTAMVPFVSLG